MSDFEFKKSGIFIIIISILALFVIFQSGEYIADFTQWITGLFGNASINPNDARGFANFAQLILIAVFVGWAIDRFKNK
jgi:hypothetical protein